MKINVQAVAVFATAVIIRLALFYVLRESSLQYLGGRIENMSPVTSFPRISEGFHLLIQEQIDPYVSGFFKLNPISASLAFTFLDSQIVYFAFLVVCDVFTGVLLLNAMGSYGTIAMAIFLLHPYTITSEFGLSAESLDTLVVAILLASKKVGSSTLAIAILALNKPIVPFVLVFPVALVLKKSIGVVLGATAGWTAVLHVLCYILTGSSTSFLKTYWSLHLITPDLEPTMGTAWNLFTMAFPDTGVFFRVVVYGHLVLISVPIYWRFQKMNQEDKSVDRVVRYLHLITAAVLMFQPYPTGINFALMQTILVACDDKYHDKMSRFMAASLIVGLFFTSAVGPLWLERNTGNANFLFYLAVVTTFVGILAVGQSLRTTRLADYVLRDKKSKSD